MEINAGRQYVQTVSVPGRPEDAIQQLTSGLAGVPGYTMIQSGPNSITFTRSFIPQWAFIGGIIAGLLTCVGFLLLLMKEEESLMVTASASAGGTRLDITGAASGAMTNRLSGMINSLGGQVAAPTGLASPPPAPQPAPVPTPAAAASPPAWHPDPTGRHEQRYWDGMKWTDEVLDQGTPSTDPPAT
jgi:hypothetical protein